MATYTFKSFKRLVESYVLPRGRAFDESETHTNLDINVRLRKFCEITDCVYRDDIAFSADSGLALYSTEYRDTGAYGFDAEVLSIESFYLGGVFLERKTVDEMKALGNYTAESGPPAYYVLMPYGDRTRVRLYPKPAQDYTDGVVAGTVAQPYLEADNDAIVIPLSYIATAATYVAVGILFPGASSADDIAAMAAINRSAGDQMQDLISKNREMLRGPMVRGTGAGSGMNTFYLG